MGLNKIPLVSTATLFTLTRILTLKPWFHVKINFQRLLGDRL